MSSRGNKWGTRKAVPVLPDIPYECRDNIRYFCWEDRPAIIASDIHGGSLAWVKNPDEDNWRVIDNPLDVQFDRGGRPHSDEVSYEEWIEVFGNDFEWTEVGEYSEEDVLALVEYIKSLRD